MFQEIPQGLAGLGEKAILNHRMPTAFNVPGMWKINRSKRRQAKDAQHEVGPLQKTKVVSPVLVGSRGKEILSKNEE